jgi:hypothetical protein
VATTQHIVATTAAASGADITVAAGSNATVWMAKATASDVLGKRDHASIQFKNFLGAYVDSGMYLRHDGLFKVLSPGIWRVSKPLTVLSWGIDLHV